MRLKNRLLDSPTNSLAMLVTRFMKEMGDLIGHIIMEVDAAQ